MKFDFWKNIYIFNLAEEFFSFSFYRRSKLNRQNCFAKKEAEMQKRRKQANVEKFESEKASEIFA